MNIRGIFTQTFITMTAVILVVISSAVETDIFIPSFPAIQSYFSTTESLVQMIISINFLGLCISSLFYGPLSDTYGRRPVLMVGMALFALSSVACIFADTITSLLFWRFIQGLGSSVALVVPTAIIYDVFDEKKAANMIGIYNSVVTFAMSSAPIVGSYLYITFNWRANFILVAALAVIAFFFGLLFVRESLADIKRVPMHLGMILTGFKQLLLHPLAMANLYIICVICGAYFAFISNLSLIFINHLGVPNASYAYYQAVILITFASFSFFSGNVIERLGISKTRMLGKIITVMGAIIFMLVALFAGKNPLLITLAMAIFSAGFALIVGILFGDYMNVFPDIKGVASSLATSIRLLAMSVLIGISSYAFNGTIMPVAIIIFIAGISSLLVMFWIQKQN